MSNTLSLTMEPDQLGEFFLLLQQGVVVEARTGCTLDELLSGQWNISPDYVGQRITTIFLDGRPIDDLSRATIRADAVIALSGAMPGLVGATMRRGGYYSAMRAAITHRGCTADVTDRTATVRVKLFNLLLPELGPSFLGRGIILNGGELADFLVDRPASFREGCSAVLFNGAPLPFRQLQEESLIPHGGQVHLTVTFKE